ncbi:sce7725 family protein [Pedobacter sp. CFBP9032]|uniref:sce7725 family protein n=1 Tax=Pedobacter sp. CFBP9032 TaxID=3096539 RepID=UPI002A6B3C1D|nr:sce7725 family protein [Pedobacter sp. CFBP9032]MDY0906529.1 sce7725 family protein [Pedobacter sp. CFBP9032]
MYFPFLRGKQFELEAIIELPNHVFNNTIPIIEPVNLPKRSLYSQICQRNFPVILIINPYHPQGSRKSMDEIQSLIDDKLTNQLNVIVGFLIDGRFSLTDFQLFINSNPNLSKAVIFRSNPVRNDLPAIQAELRQNPVRYLIFDGNKTTQSTKNVFAFHNDHVLLYDGFQRQDKNLNYPVASAFDSIFDTWRIAGLAGCGDYVTIGDYFMPGGGQVRVVTIHITVNTENGLEVIHFSSTVNAGVSGLAAEKVVEAIDLLVHSPSVRPLQSVGLEILRSFHASGHNPQLGALKKASIMHHIELMSSII